MNNLNIVKLIAVGIVLGLIGLLVSGNLQFESPDTKSSPTDVSAKQGLNIGDKAPDFTLTTVDGVNLTLSDVQGKILVITSGAAWCPTCIIENKNFNPVYQEVKDKGVEFVTVDIDPIDDEKAVKEFQKLYAPWHNVQQVYAKKMIQDYDFWRFEITYIIDREGIVQFKDSGITPTETLRVELNKLI